VSNARAKAEIYLQEQRLNRLNKNFEMQTKEVERRFRHDDWMEEQKRDLFRHKIQDLATGPTKESLNTSDIIRGTPLDVNWQVKPTTLLDSVQLDVEQHKDTQRQEELNQVDEEEGALDIYFDTIFGAPHDIKDSELCFCLQRNGTVLSDPQPHLVKMNNIQGDLTSPDFVRLLYL